MQRQVAEYIETINEALAWAPDVAVLVPCYNEEATVGSVVRDFRTCLPHATVYVYDNNSSDRTIEEAEKAGATVHRQPLQGKGNVVRRMFADIEADIYILVDGDDTYDAASASEMIQRLMDESLDLVNGARIAESNEAYRAGHQFGNKLLTGLVRRIFGARMNDMLSGYKVLSRRFVKSFPALASGFETEIELSIHALELRMPIIEMPTPYRSRPENSVSKLSTYRDGFRILWTILVLTKEERPQILFSMIFAMLALVSLGLAGPLMLTYLETGLVPRLPTAVLACGTMLLAFLSLTCGLILDTVTRGRQEMKRIQYLAIPAPGIPAVESHQLQWSTQED